MTTAVSSFDTQHSDIIHDAQMDYYGKRLATCSSDKMIKIFDCTSNKNAPTKVAELVGHEGPVWQLAWVPNPKYGSILASCSYDKKVIIWKEDNPNKWVKLYEYSGHELSVNSVAWAPVEFGLMLACGSSDGNISVIYWKGGNEWTKTKFMGHSLGVNTISWAPAAIPSSLLNQSPAEASAARPRFASGGSDNLIKVWQFVNNEWSLETTLTGHTDWVRDVAWAPNLGLPYTTIASCSQDGHVFIWTQDHNSNWSKKQLCEKFNCVVWRVSWSITGNILAISGGDNKVTLWKETGDEWKCISTLDENDPNATKE